MGLLVTLVILVVAVVLAFVEARRLERLGPFQVFAAGWVLLIAAVLVAYLLARDVAEGFRDAFGGTSNNEVVAPEWEEEGPLSGNPERDERIQRAYRGEIGDVGNSFNQCVPVRHSEGLSTIEAEDKCFEEVFGEKP